jgi:hypothetical protein
MWFFRLLRHHYHAEARDDLYCLHCLKWLSKKFARNWAQEIEHLQNLNYAKYCKAT